MTIDADNVIIGTCQEMCPPEERALREKEGILSRFEVIDSASGTSQPRADPARIVKCFSRSAAGQALARPHTLRPAPILIATVKYLVGEVASRTNENLIDIYDFVCDRLRGVRQDMTIQRLSAECKVCLLEPMVRFHVLYGYKLANNPEFDLHLNDKHLQECLHLLLSLYRDEPDINFCNQIEIETIYMCVNLDRPEKVLNIIEFQNEDSWCNTQILLSWCVRNYIRVLRLALILPLISKLAFARHIPTVRIKALEAMCHAFSSKNCAYPVQCLVKALSYNGISDLISDCTRLGISIVGNNVKFNKNNFIKDAKTTDRNIWWVAEEELANTELGNLLKGDFLV